jgi:asparagine synthase (glutamine-hydrolysing)
MFAGVSQIPQGSRLRVRVGQPLGSPVKYWAPRRERAGVHAEAETAKQLRCAFARTIGLHMRSDAPIGVSLSGGLDSSAILAMCAAIGGDSRRIQAFTFVANDPALSELRWARRAASAGSVTLATIELSAADVLASISQIIRAQGEPFGGMSVVAQFHVFRAASAAGVKVMLNGQGADELLAGYEPFVSARLASLLRQRRPMEALRLLSRASKRSGLGKAFYIMRLGDHVLDEPARNLARQFVGKHIAPSWLNAEWFLARGVTFRSTAFSAKDDVLREQVVQAIRETSLPNLLRFEDRNSMAHSVESRVPFLTTALAEICLALPEDLLIGKDGVTKWIFRRALAGIVPDPIVCRRDKIGFAVPEGQWLSELRHWVSAVLAGPLPPSASWLNVDELKRQWGRMTSGEQPYDQRIWRSVNALLWAKEFDVVFD